MNFDVNQRYRLYCKVSQVTSKQTNEAASLPIFKQLQQNIQQQLPQLIAKMPPQEFLRSWQQLQDQLERLDYFCIFPKLLTRKVVAVGGRFSAGKSSFINSILGKKQLITDVNPTTSVPTYLLRGDSQAIIARNLFQQSIGLDADEFASLVHDEMEQYGSSISALLSCAYIEHPDFKFENLVLLDTPGYSKPKDEDSSHTDENISRLQLNTADYIVWLVSAEDGTITEDDIQFLGSLQPHIPKLVLLNKADKKAAEDVNAIIQLVKKTLLERNIKVLDVLPVSRNLTSYPLDQVLQILQTWGEEEFHSKIALNFKLAWRDILAFYANIVQKLQLRLNRLNRIVTLTDSDAVAEDIAALASYLRTDLAECRQLQEQVMAQSNVFFHNLASLGAELGVDLHEPSSLEMLKLEPEHQLLSILQSMRKDNNAAPPDYAQLWLHLNQTASAKNANQLVRRDSQRFIPTLQSLQIQQENYTSSGLLRQVNPQQKKQMAELLGGQQ